MEMIIDKNPLMVISYHSYRSKQFLYVRRKKTSKIVQKMQIVSRCHIEIGIFLCPILLGVHRSSEHKALQTFFIHVNRFFDALTTRKKTHPNESNSFVSCFFFFTQMNCKIFRLLRKLRSGQRTEKCITQPMPMIVYHHK